MSARAHVVMLVAVFSMLASGCNSASSPPAATPTVSTGNLAIDCRDVPEDLCRANAVGAASGPQPSGAGQIVKVVVTCEVNLPCRADRLDSGGQVTITYDDGTSWSQDWAVGAGT